MVPEQLSKYSPKIKLPSICEVLLLMDFLDEENIILQKEKR